MSNSKSVLTCEQRVVIELAGEHPKANYKIKGYISLLKAAEKKKKKPNFVIWSALKSFAIEQGIY